MPLIVPLYCLMVYDCKLIFFIKYKFLNAPSLARSLKLACKLPVWYKYSWSKNIQMTSKSCAFVLRENDVPSPLSVCPASKRRPGSDASPDMGRSSASHLGKLQEDPGRAWHSWMGSGTWKCTIILNTTAWRIMEHRHTPSSSLVLLKQC